MGTRGLGFDNQINEGATDYLASKLSGEKARNYYQGHKLFEKLEPMLIKYTKNENILMQMYLTNDVKFMEDFFELFWKCQNFIKNELPMNLDIVEAPSMLESAQDLRNHNLTYASIGNKKIAENFHDDKNNMTRYVLIGDVETKPSGHDRTTIAFRTTNEPGALLEILKVFLEHKINLTYISSRPSKVEIQEYIFIVVFEGHIKNPNMLEMIEDIKPKTSFFRCLGSYKCDC